MKDKYCIVLGGSFYFRSQILRKEEKEANAAGICSPPKVIGKAGAKLIKLTNLAKNTINYVF
jgi:hypothetical protein